MKTAKNNEDEMQYGRSFLQSDRINSYSTMENENRFWSVSLVLYPFYNKFNRFDRWCVSENDKLLQTKSRSHGHGWHLRHESSCPSNDAEITLCRPSWLKCRYRRKQTIGPFSPWVALLLKSSHIYGSMLFVFRNLEMSEYATPRSAGEN